MLFAALHYVGYWHGAADHTLTDDGRFRREADMHRGVAATASVADDPNPTSAGSKSRSAAVLVPTSFRPAVIHDTYES